jgi:hypothetical protein
MVTINTAFSAYPITDVAVLAEVCAGWASSDAGALAEVWVVLWSDAVFEAARDALQRAVARP